MNVTSGCKSKSNGANPAQAACKWVTLTVSKSPSSEDFVPASSTNVSSSFHSIQIIHISTVTARLILQHIRKPLISFLSHWMRFVAQANDSRQLIRSLVNVARNLPADKSSSERASILCCRNSGES